MMPQLKSKSNKIAISKKEKNFHKKLTQLQDFVEKNCEYVGDKFAQEARNIHYDKKKSKTARHPTQYNDTMLSYSNA